MITAEAEREKYKKMWAVKAYRSNSPGEGLVSYFLQHSGAQAQKGDTLIDLGCGTGRAGLVLAKLGFHITLLDHCEEALDAKVKAANLPFIEANLWTLPKFCRWDWGYCTDVMEHIPTEHVDGALAGIAANVQHCFFQIAMFDDGFGKQIHEKLHLTIQNDSWWLAKLKEHFTVEKAGILSFKRLVAFVRSNNA